MDMVPDITRKRIDYLWILAIAGTILGAVLLSGYGLFLGIPIVFPHLFYLPIVLISYRYPKYGVSSSILLTAVYLLSVWIVSPGADLFLAAGLRGVIFIAIGVVVSVLSGRLYSQYEEVQWRNTQLEVMNRVIGLSAGSNSPEDLIRAFISVLRDHLKARAGAVFLRGRAENMELKFAEGFSEDEYDAIRNPDLLHGPYADAFVHGEVVFFTEFLLRGKEGDERVYAGVNIPIIEGGQVIGGILLLREPVRPFSPGKKGILEAVGTEMGSAYHRAQLQRKLEIAIDEANLYIDIMSHDINNANTAAIWYSSFLIESLAGSERDFARKILNSVQKSVEIIKNVTTIRRLHETVPRIRPMSLDTVISEEILRFSDANITYPGYTGQVYADDLLSEVITNLIGNSLKFGGPDVAITIEIEEKGEMVEVAVNDTGPGIPDEDKPEIFTRFKRGKSKRSGKGLGLYIARMLIEGYGGSIRATDRVIGHPEQGASIRFTLRRVEEPA